VSQKPDYSWRYEAKCRGMDTEIFFPPRDKSLYKPIADSAKAVCWGRDSEDECVVRRECLLDAIETDELHGIRGGMSHRERNALVRRWQRLDDDSDLEEYVWNL